MNNFKKKILDYFENNKKVFVLNVQKRGPLPRFFDQKLKTDVLNINAKCIKHIFEKKKWFTISDVWKDEFTKEEVYNKFKKPKTDDKKLKNEYDKFFGQIFNFLSFYYIIHPEKKGKINLYTVLDDEIINFLAESIENCSIFISTCNEQFIKENNLSKPFEIFFNTQDQESFINLKEDFISFIWKHTNISYGKKTEAGRIFSPFLNSISYSRNKYGTKKGFLSPDIITFKELLYENDNFRFKDTDKKKGESRDDFIKRKLCEVDEQQVWHALEREAVKKVKNLNNNISEFSGEKNAHHIHHIFPRHEYRDLCYLKENLISLTPTEHLSKAHPNNNTRIICKDFQKELLKNKFDKIVENYEFYSVKSFVKILNSGYKLDLPESLDHNDIKRVLNR